MLSKCPAFETSRRRVGTGSSRTRSWEDPFVGSYGCLSTVNVYERWPPSLDGSSERRDVYSGPRRASATTAEQPALTERASVPAAIPSRPRGTSSVADRVRSINENPKDKTSNPVSRSDRGKAPVPHRTSTNLSKRMSPFMRRGADAIPPAEQSPVLRLQEPQPLTVIDTPVPQRHASLLFRSPATPRPSEVLRSERGPSRSRPDFIRRPLDVQRGEQFGASEVGRPGSSASCPRHGRKLKGKTRAGPTIDGMERSRSGAYIPSSFKTRRQIPATSPYFYLAKGLTKAEGTSLSPEPCPDCIAEETIRKREDAERALDPPLLNSSPEGSQETFDVSSVTTEPGTPVEQTLTGPSLVGTSTDHQTFLLPGSSVPSIIEADMSSIVAADLGDMIDAIIIQHRGTLNKVITNLRNSAPSMDSFQQISRDLASVSTSMTMMKPERADVLGAEQGRYSIILDTPPDFLTSRTRSIPDLMDYIDSAAKDLGIPLPPKPLSPRPSESQLPTPRAEGTDRPRISLDQGAGTLRVRAGDKGLAPPRRGGTVQDSAYTTANPSPAASDDAQRAASPSISDNNPVPMTGSEGKMNLDSMTPSEPQGAKGQAGDGDAITSANRVSSIKSDVPKSDGTRTDGSWESQPTVSKIPAPTPTGPTAGPSRRHSVRPSAVRTKDPAWSQHNESSRRASLHKTGPREGSETGKSQGTFTQPFVKELARDASLRERSGRRLRWRRAAEKVPA